MITVTCISDLHGFTPAIAGGELLIVCGDLTARDTLEGFAKFIKWINALDFRCKIVIGGNHDGLIEKGIVEAASFGPDIHYLCDSGFEYEGVKIWGSPYTPTFLNWHFMRDRGPKIKKHWDLIPEDTDILVTHGPPKGILDMTEDGFAAGCLDLKNAILDRVKPKIHCFGHIHEGGGQILEMDGVKFVNCSYVDERYRPVHGPITITLTQNR